MLVYTVLKLTVDDLRLTIENTMQRSIVSWNSVVQAYKSSRRAGSGVLLEVSAAVIVVVFPPET
jgi:hypothetical protein